MSVWQLVSPAPRSALLDLAPAHARVRRLWLGQSRYAETVAVLRDDVPIAAMMFARHGWRRTEVALAAAPAAAGHMGRLIRMAQLTLFPLAETRLIVAKVHPANRAGQRMASLVGFRPAKSPPGLWILRSERHG